MTEYMDACNDTTGVILAGGKSTRMGCDKALLILNGETLFRRVLHVLQGLFSDIIIAGDRPDLACFHVPYHPDPYPGSSLGGIYTGLCASTRPYIFVAACDIPFPDPEPVRIILSHRRDNDVVIFKTPGGFEPCFALYSQRCRGPIKTMLTQGLYHIVDFFPHVKVCHLDAAVLVPQWESSLKNVNTPEEFSSIKE